ncbi:MAG: hypothetical protein RL141_118 [Candidatus Parcubacteria bacterium]|jgi:hypothetical protein
MRIETGNLEILNGKNPERKGWIIGTFIPEDSLMHSSACEVKWATHPKGLQKKAGTNLDSRVRTMIILISGKWLTRFLGDGKEVILSKPGDYLIYEGASHENEALEDSQMMIVRWGA